jgi:hypothetical protein
MDDALIRFRHAADREKRHRRLRRRYSSALQHDAVAYWQRRRRKDGVRTIAAALGVSVTTLQRWTRASARRSRFRPIEVVAAAPAINTGAAAVAIQITAAGPRVEGLTVETAARLLALLR